MRYLYMMNLNEEIKRIKSLMVENDLNHEFQTILVFVTSASHIPPDKSHPYFLL